MARMPALYIPHGGGPSFFMTGERKQLFQQTEDFLRGIDQYLPAPPSAILIVTAHWEAAVPTFTSGTKPSLIYDYYGFPPETYALQYPASGHPALAEQAAQLLEQAGFSARTDADYGWDHGVFIPLKVMYPDASIPVVAMSLQDDLDPGLHCQLGRALAWRDVVHLESSAPAKFSRHLTVRLPRGAMFRDVAHAGEFVMQLVEDLEAERGAHADELWVETAKGGAAPGGAESIA